MVDTQQLQKLLNSFHLEFVQLIDLQNKNDSLVSCLEYIEVLQSRLEAVRGENNSQKTYGVLRQISQMNKGILDINGWEPNDNISNLLNQITDEASSLIRLQNL